MQPFVESNSLLDNPPELRRRLRDDGYLFLREILPKDDVLDLRRQVLEICAQFDWLRPGADVLEGLADRDPICEDDEEYLDVYARIQSLENFHRLKFNESIIRIMENLFQEPVIPLPKTIARIAFPRDNARATQAHQDWIFVGGSMDTISCWAPLGDVPLEVGGLKILAGSHKAGFLEPRGAAGPGNRVVDVDPSLEWHQSGYRSGDVLLFKALTVHAGADNLTSDVLRLSVDFRYTGESHTIAEKWLQPHFEDMGDPFTWDTLDKEWRDSPIARYWERLPNLKVKRHDWFWETGTQS